MENKAFGEDVNEGNALSGGRRIKFEDTESNGSSKRMPENVYREVDASSSGTENNSSPSKRPDWFKSQSTKERLYGLSPTAGGQNRDEDGANVWGPESELPCRLPGCKPLHVIHPSGLFRSRWNIIAVVFILYTSIELPMSLAFSTCNSINSASFWIGVIVDLFFIADLLINTTTGFTDDGEIILSYALAWRHYVKSPGFFIDLVSTIPLGKSNSYSGAINTSCVCQLMFFSPIPRLLKSNAGGCHGSSLCFNNQGNKISPNIKNFPTSSAIQITKAISLQQEPH